MLKYVIYFDESNKLDQPMGNYSYYGALGSYADIISDMSSNIQHIKNELKSLSELHFVDYTNDTHFEKYFRSINEVLSRDISINLMIVNKIDAKHVAEKMSVSLSELRELFYVKIPERLFYGMTRKLSEKQKIDILIDKDSHYEKIDLEKKLAEQMNAHSAYRNKCYKVDKVEQVSSEETIPLQIIDVFLGILVFLLEKQYKNKSINSIIKSDLIYRIFIHEENLHKFHNKINIFKWEEETEEIFRVNLSDYTGEFLIYKTQFDIREMIKLEKYRLQHPDADTKFYRECMGYSTRQLKMIQGYIDQLNEKGRNSHFL